jgi:hypothetical protein
MESKKEIIDNINATVHELRIHSTNMNFHECYNVAIEIEKIQKLSIIIECLQDISYSIGRNTVMKQK